MSTDEKIKKLQQDALRVIALLASVLGPILVVTGLAMDVSLIRPFREPLIGTGAILALVGFLLIARIWRTTSY